MIANSIEEAWEVTTLVVTVSVIENLGGLHAGVDNLGGRNLGDPSHHQHQLQRGPNNAVNIVSVRNGLAPKADRARHRPKRRLLCPLDGTRRD